MTQFSNLLVRVKSEIVVQALTTILGAALILALTRLLGPKRYGILFLTVSILTFARIFSEAGVAKSGARYITEYKERKPSQIPHIIQISLGYNIVTILVVVTVVVIFRFHIADIFDETRLAVLLLYGIFFVIFGTLVRYVRVILQGFEEIKLSAVIHMLVIVCRFIFAIGLVLLGYGIWGALGGYIMSFTLISALGLVLLYVRFYQTEGVDTPTEYGLRRRIAEYSLPLVATNAAKALDLHIDTILVGLLLNPTSVGMYVLAKQITQFLETPAYAVGFSLAPTLGADKTRDNIQRSSYLYRTSLFYLLLVYLPASAGVVLVSEPIIRYAFGNTYLEAVPVVQILSLYVVFRVIAAITENSLDYLGRARLRAIIKLPTIALNIVLNIIFIQYFDIIGAAFATIVSHGLFTIATMYIIRMELNSQISYLKEKMIIIVVITGIIYITTMFGLQFVNNIYELSLLVFFEIIIWGMLVILSNILGHHNLKSDLV
jgi:O-antigen/teichoic acid export membrane protein